jgi:hypothetical protein
VKADVAAISRQVEVALLYDGKLDVTRMSPEREVVMDKDYLPLKRAALSRRLKDLSLLHGCGLTRKQTDKSSLGKITFDDFEWPQVGNWLRNDFSVTDHHWPGLVFRGKQYVSLARAVFAA